MLKYTNSETSERKAEQNEQQVIATNCNKKLGDFPLLALSLRFIRAAALAKEGGGGEVEDVCIPNVRKGEEEGVGREEEEEQKLKDEVKRHE